MVFNHLIFADGVFNPSINGHQSFQQNKWVLFCPKKYKQLASSNVFLYGAHQGWPTSWLTSQSPSVSWSILHWT